MAYLVDQSGRYLAAPNGASLDDGRDWLEMTTPIGHWPCQDRAGSTVVFAASGSPATLSGGNSTVDLSENDGPGSAFSRSLHLDGSADYLALPNLASSMGDTGSVMMWIKLDDANPALQGQTGLWNFGPFNSNSTHYPWTTGVGFFSTFRYTANATLTRVDNVVLPAGVTRTNWHHIAITQTPGANGWKLIIDGSVVTQTTGLSPLYWDNDAWNVGRSIQTAGGSFYYVDGRIADVRIYDTDQSANIDLIMAEKDAAPGSATGGVVPPVGGAIGAWPWHDLCEGRI